MQRTWRLLRGWPAIVLSAWVVAGQARAATVDVRAPEACVDAGQLAEQVATLIGRPLAAVAGVAFVLAITPQSPGWRLQLDMVAGGPESNAVAARSRELTAPTCMELADAAAVAIAMSIRSLEVVAPRPVPAAPASAAAPPPPALAAAPADSTVSVSASWAKQAARPSLALSAAAVGGLGALPGPGIGIEVGGAVSLSALRLIARGTVFASQEKRLGDGSGGDFTFAFGTLLACGQVAAGRPTVLGCAGFELGRLSGDGVGLARPRTGGAMWQALSAEVGVLVPVTRRVAAVVRGGASVPLRRPEFVVDGAARVHRAASLDGRLVLGLELSF
jgi:hypothetical protein